MILAMHRAGQAVTSFSFYHRDNALVRFVRSMVSGQTAFAFYKRDSVPARLITLLVGRKVAIGFRFPLFTMGNEPIGGQNWWRSIGEWWVDQGFRPEHKRLLPPPEPLSLGVADSLFYSSMMPGPLGDSLVLTEDARRGVIETFFAELAKLPSVLLGVPGLDVGAPGLDLESQGEAYADFLTAAARGYRSAADIDVFGDNLSTDLLPGLADALDVVASTYRGPGGPAMVVLHTASSALPGIGHLTGLAQAYWRGRVNREQNQRLDDLESALKANASLVDDVDETVLADAATEATRIAENLTSGGQALRKRWRQPS